MCGSRALSPPAPVPSLPGPRRPLDLHAARGHRPPDDGGLSEPEPGRAARPLHADARGLRTGCQPGHAHRQGPPTARQLPQARRGLLPDRRAQAGGEQPGRAEAVPARDRLTRLSRRAQRAALLRVLQQLQELLAAAAAGGGKQTETLQVDGTTLQFTLHGSGLTIFTSFPDLGRSEGKSWLSRIGYRYQPNIHADNEMFS